MRNNLRIVNNGKNIQLSKHTLNLLKGGGQRPPGSVSLWQCIKGACYIRIASGPR